MTAKKENTAKQQAKSVAETVKTGAENAGLAALSTGEVEKARNEGVKDAITENAKDQYNYATDGQLPGEPPVRQFTDSDSHTNLIDHMLSMSPDSLKEAVDEKADSPMSEGQVANLLKLERAGQNRTAYVELLCKRLKVKSPYEVTDAGPGYTNDVSNIKEVA
jgi:hypothetical protein